MYDLTTDAGKVRLLISDVDEDNHVFDDAEIDVFLDLTGDVVLLAAALALETVAANEVLILKYVRSRGLDLDGPSVGRELRQQAKQWRDQAAADAEADDEYTFDIVRPAAGHDYGYIL